MVRHDCIRHSSFTPLKLTVIRGKAFFMLFLLYFLMNELQYSTYETKQIQKDKSRIGEKGVSRQRERNKFCLSILHNNLMTWLLLPTTVMKISFRPNCPLYLLMFVNRKQNLKIINCLNHQNFKRVKPIRNIK